MLETRYNKVFIHENLNWKKLYKQWMIKGSNKDPLSSTNQLWILHGHLINSAIKTIIKNS